MLHFVEKDTEDRNMGFYRQINRFTALTFGKQITLLLFLFCCFAVCYAIENFDNLDTEDRNMGFYGQKTVSRH